MEFANDNRSELARQRIQWLLEKEALRVANEISGLSDCIKTDQRKIANCETFIAEKTHKSPDIVWGKDRIAGLQKSIASCEYHILAFKEQILLMHSMLSQLQSN